MRELIACQYSTYSKPQIYLLLMFEEDFMGQSATRGSMGRMLHGRRYPKGPREPTEGSKRDIRPLLDEDKQAT